VIVEAAGDLIDEEEWPFDEVVGGSHTSSAEPRTCCTFPWHHAYGVCSKPRLVLIMHVLIVALTIS
jgi:hypothetical protein